jgi:hypothetical protein
MFFLFLFILLFVVTAVVWIASNIHLVVMFCIHVVVTFMFCLTIALIWKAILHIYKTLRKRR